MYFVVVFFKGIPRYFEMYYLESGHWVDKSWFFEVFVSKALIFISQ